MGNISGLGCYLWFSLKLENHVVCWIVCSHTSVLVLWSIGSWLGNLLRRGNTTVARNIMDAVGWDVVGGSWVISINICWFPVVPWPWVEVGKWSCFSLHNHVIRWIISSHSGVLVLWSIGCWLGNLLGRSDTTVTGNIMDAVGRDVVGCSWVISINICWFPVVSWPWMEVGEWGCLTWAWNLSNHVIGWIVCSHTSILMLRSVCSWLGNLFGGGDTTVSSNIMNTVGWDIIWCSRIISINISWFPVVSWPWMEVGKWSGLMFVMMFVVVLKLHSRWVAKEGSNYLCIFHW